MPLVLDRCLGGEEHVYTLSTQRRTLLFKTAAPEEPGQPLSPAHVPLSARGTVEGSAAACHLPPQTSALAACHANELSVLPSPPPSGCPSSALPRDGHPNGRADCRQMFGCSPASPGTGQLKLPHQYPGSWVCKPADGAQVCPAFRKPTKNRGQCLERGHLWVKVSLPCTVAILTKMRISFLCWF